MSKSPFGFARVRISPVRISKGLLYCNLIGLQCFCSRTNPGIGLVPDLPSLFAKVGLHPTRQLAGTRAQMKYYAAVYIIGMFYWCVLTGNAVLRDALATMKGEMKGKVIEGSALSAVYVPV